MMKELELNISKVLIGLITIDEFESIIYQEYYVEQMKSNDFISNIITINYKNKKWKKELEELIYELWVDNKYLTYVLYKYCHIIIENTDSETVFHTMDKIAELCIKYDYEYDTLMQFYGFADELGFILSGYGSRSAEKLILDIKTYARLYSNTYNINQDVQVLLNLEEGLDKKVNRVEKLRDKKTPSDFLEKSKNNRKWFQFWK
ncbi:hypothetical protein [Aquimarina mytili]|uniref:Uncharacterized protein n=1 Tax=Aquimarina mytili TaxID=874423 RepID=A0A936ZVX6_9FLAO|nr:hypothetical protein [Aquimarina mytili]MBL0682913.1 hypothetical protein [Aquimarina mytili]